LFIQDGGNEYSSILTSKGTRILTAILVPHKLPEQHVGPTKGRRVQGEEVLRRAHPGADKFDVPGKDTVGHVGVDAEVPGPCVEIRVGNAAVVDSVGKDFCRKIISQWSVSASYSTQSADVSKQTTQHL
jgi:hypothetical protein